MSDRGDVKQMNETDPSDLTGRKNKVTTKLQKRDNERVAEIEKKKVEKESVTATHENADFFSSNFLRTKRDIETRLDASGSVSKSSLPTHFDSIHSVLQTMQKFVTDSTLFLTPYEVAKAQETVNKLQCTIQSKRAELIPKKSFSFGSKSRKPTTKKPKNTTAEKQTLTVKRSTDIDFADCCFKNIERQDLVMNAEEVNEKDVALSRLKNCTIHLYGSPGALHISNISDCKIFIGPVSGSIFIEECTNCTFALSCQQLRVHNTVDSHFYVHVTSRAIIEDCRQVEFAPNSWTYDGQDNDYVLSGLNKSINSWNDVDDFNWLASDTPSPNWSILSETKRLVFHEANE